MSISINNSTNQMIFNENIIHVFNSVAEILFEIYKAYFPNEISLSENLSFLKDTSQKNYFLFIKEFEICPDIINRTEAMQIYLSEINPDVDIHINNNRNHYLKIIKSIDIDGIIKYNPKNMNILGQYLHFFKFMRLILKIADIGYEKIDEVKGNIYEKIILFFKKIELSNGFINLEKKTNKTNNSKTNIILPKNLLEISTERVEQSIKLNMTLNNIINNIEESCTHTDYIYDNYSEDLLSIYESLCGIGNHLNIKYMRSTIFYKFLLESKLILPGCKQNRLKMNEIDTLYMKLVILTKSNTRDVYSKGKINFNSFIHAIEILARIYYSSLEIKEAIDLIIKNNILTNLTHFNDKDNDLEIKEYYMIKDNRPELVELIEIMKKNLYFIFEFYSSNTEFLIFDEFMK